MSDLPEPPYPEQEQDEPELESRMDPKPDYGLESYTGFGRLQDKAAIITGGDSGIGRAVALAFAREGADVLISYLEADEDAAETCRAVAYQPSPELLPYSTTKGAIVTFTKGLAQDLVRKGIRVNAVAPGPVWTPLIPMSMDAETSATFGQDNPMGRPAQPAEMAPVYVFLASDESRWVNGQTIGATGGMPF